jgi:hypothetical protein
VDLGPRQIDILDEICKQNLFWRGGLWIIPLAPFFIPDFLGSLPCLFGIARFQNAPVPPLPLKELVIVMPNAGITFFARLPNSNFHSLLLSAAVRKKQRYFITVIGLGVFVERVVCCPFAHSTNSPR